MRPKRVGLLRQSVEVPSPPSPRSPPPRTLLVGGLGSSSPPIIGADSHGITSFDQQQLNDQRPQRRYGLLSAIKAAIMDSWVSEKKKSPEVRIEYVALTGEGEEGIEGCGRCTSCGLAPPRKKLLLKKKWSLQIYVTIMGIALLIGIFFVNLGDSIKHSILGDRNSPNDYDPFVNWGKPGSGTEELSWYPTDFLQDVLPIPAHSHNDYWRKVPLFSALWAGCTGVEADVWLRNGDLLVGHDLASLQVNRTFQNLYVNPLVDILTHQNPTTPFYNGTSNGVFDTDASQTLVLLIDLKTDGPKTWPWVIKQLEPLRERNWLSYYANGTFHKRPITVVGTGNTPFDQILTANATAPFKRDAFFDAPLDKLEDSPYDWTNSYYASVSFFRSIGLVFWKGEPSPGQLFKIRTHIAEAKERGLKSRYWELPAWPIHVRNRVWEVLVEEGIDMLNVDDLKAAKEEDWRKAETFRRIRW
ncbi:hypothetical protein QBC35DRAFT_293611 [Podospora australis]|uniref:Altered inheritance of mitochondria protein 6 n=1 Tax=Podospora australis TaxID=1536484 RepID=A0AAN7AM02_9PEZI|nr:hypothetical protein QBC35DRAFT_293611 [Podospora australis]